jgi:hypothetical protein
MSGQERSTDEHLLSMISSVMSRLARALGTSAYSPPTVSVTGLPSRPNNIELS